MSALLIEGWLSKRSSGTIRRWQRRYFVIVDATLNYYMDMGAMDRSEVKTAFDLSTLRELHIDGTEMRLEGTSGSSFELKADSEHQIKLWTKALRSFIPTSGSQSVNVQHLSSNRMFSRKPSASGRLRSGSSSASTAGAAIGNNSSDAGAVNRQIGVSSDDDTSDVAAASVPETNSSFPTSAASASRANSRAGADVIPAVSKSAPDSNCSPLIQGYLRVLRFGQWQKQYFELVGTSLRHYADALLRDDGSLRGTVDVSLEVESCCLSVGSSGSAELELKLRGSEGGKMRLRAKDRRRAGDWAVAICGVTGGTAKLHGDLSMIENGTSTGLGVKGSDKSVNANDNATSSSSRRGSVNYNKLASANRFRMLHSRTLDDYISHNHAVNAGSEDYEHVVAAEDESKAESSSDLSPVAPHSTRATSNFATGISAGMHTTAKGAGTVASVGTDQSKTLSTVQVRSTNITDEEATAQAAATAADAAAAAALATADNSMPLAQKSATVLACAETMLVSVREVNAQALSRALHELGLNGDSRAALLSLSQDANENKVPQNDVDERILRSLIAFLACGSRAAGVTLVHDTSVEELKEMGVGAACLAGIFSGVHQHEGAAGAIAHKIVAGSDSGAALASIIHATETAAATLQSLSGDEAVDDKTKEQTFVQTLQQGVTAQEHKRGTTDATRPSAADLGPRGNALLSEAAHETLHCCVRVLIHLLHQEHGVGHVLRKSDISLQVRGVRILGTLDRFLPMVQDRRSLVNAAGNVSDAAAEAWCAFAAASGVSALLAVALRSRSIMRDAATESQIMETTLDAELAFALRGRWGPLLSNNFGRLSTLEHLQKEAQKAFAGGLKGLLRRGVVPRCLDARRAPAQQYDLVVESDHPYSEYESQTWLLRIANAKEVIVRFDQRSCTASSNDQVVIFVPDVDSETSLQSMRDGKMRLDPPRGAAAQKRQHFQRFGMNSAGSTVHDSAQARPAWPGVGGQEPLHVKGDTLAIRFFSAAGANTGEDSAAALTDNPRWGFRACVSGVGSATGSRLVWWNEAIAALGGDAAARVIQHNFRATSSARWHRRHQAAIVIQRTIRAYRACVWVERHAVSLCRAQIQTKRAAESEKALAERIRTPEMRHVRRAFMLAASETSSQAPNITSAKLKGSVPLSSLASSAAGGRKSEDGTIGKRGEQKESGSSAADSVMKDTEHFVKQLAKFELELDAEIGLESVKSYCAKLKLDFLARQIAGEQLALRHVLISGPTGCGKRCAAQWIGRLLRIFSVTPNAPVQIDLNQALQLAEEITGGGGGGSRPAKLKRLADRLDTRSDEVLLVTLGDELDTVLHNDYAIATVNALLDRCPPVVLCTGSQEHIDRFAGMMRAFRKREPARLTLKPLEASQLAQICARRIEDKGLRLDWRVTEEKFGAVITQNWSKEELAKQNGYICPELVERAITNKNARLGTHTHVRRHVLTLPDFDLFGTMMVQGARKAIDDEIDAMVGMSDAKELIAQIRKKVQYFQAGGPPEVLQTCLNIVITGNPGTGKTTFARLLFRFLRAYGVLKKDVFVECNALELKAKYVGHTSGNVKQKVQSALGGCLFLDEAYALAGERGSDGDSFSGEAIRTLLTEVENNRTGLLVVLAGYQDKMKLLMQADPGMPRRFPQTLHLADYTPQQLAVICRKVAKSRFGMSLAPDLEEKLVEEFEGRYFVDIANQNGGLAVNLVENATGRLAERIMEQTSNADSCDVPDPASSSNKTLQLVDFGIDDDEGAQETIDAIDEEVASMIGMDNIKAFFAQVRKKVQYVQAGGQPQVLRTCLNMVVTGNPGTGKTTFARLLFRFLRAYGVLKKDNFVECNALELKGKYLGQTCGNVRSIVQSALGGCLFLDEAYALAGDGHADAFSNEAIRTLLTEVENNRTGLLVVLAGYQDKMKLLMQADPGMPRRFPQTLHLADYTPQQLASISIKVADERFGMSFEDGLRARLAQHFADNYTAAIPKQNGGLAVNVVENATACLVERIMERSQAAAALQADAGEIEGFGINLQDDECKVLVAADFGIRS